MGFTCILLTNTFLVGHYWDFKVGMKAHLIYICLLYQGQGHFPRLKLVFKVNVKYKGHTKKKIFFLGHWCFTNTVCFFLSAKLIEVLMLRDKSSYDKFMEYVEYLYPHVFTMVTNKEPRHPPPGKWYFSPCFQRDGVMCSIKIAHLNKRQFNRLPHNPDFYWKKAFENIVEKGENAGKQHFLLLPQCFFPC